jgi:hypothetical protein
VSAGAAWNVKDRDGFVRDSVQTGAGELASSATAEGLHVAQEQHEEWKRASAFSRGNCSIVLDRDPEVGLGGSRSCRFSNRDGVRLKAKSGSHYKPVEFVYRLH